MINCQYCSKPFKAKKNKKYCSDKCRAASWIKSPGNRQLQQRYRFKLRKQFIEMYGNKCNCCGEQDWHFLTMDHIGGEGRIIRRNKSVCNQTEFRRAIKEYRPDIFQVLCLNCNAAKYWYGQCPHSKEDK